MIVEFLGGLQLLCDRHEKKHEFKIAEQYDLNTIIPAVANKFLIKEQDLFYDQSTGQLQDGIIYMVNGADVELLREEDQKYVFKDSDTVSFISMIHGG